MRRFYRPIKKITERDYHENLTDLEKGDLCLVMIPGTAGRVSTTASAGPPVEMLSFDEFRMPNCYVFTSDNGKTTEVTEGCIVRLNPMGIMKAHMLVELDKIEQEELRHRDGDHDMLERITYDTYAKYRKIIEDGIRKL
jgi:hypothetical protein